MTGHLPRRPNWTCQVDDRPWPCLPARIDLTLAHHPADLSTVMVGWMERAAADELTPQELWRFVSWTAPTPVSTG